MIILHCSLISQSDFLKQSHILDIKKEEIL